MPQAPRTASDIITNAFYLIGLITPDRVPSDSLAARGLYALNNILDSFSGTALEIPFIQELTFNMQTGKDVYSFSNVVPADVVSERISSLEYVRVVYPGGASPGAMDNVIDSVKTIDLSILYNSRRYSGIASRPCLVALDRQAQVSNLVFYPKPDLAYQILLRAKFMLSNLEAQQVISNLPPWYYRFLEYSVARELANYYPAVQWTDKLEKQYEEQCEMIRRSTTMNMTLQPDGILQSRGTNFAYPYPFGVI